MQQNNTLIESALQQLIDGLQQGIDQQEELPSDWIQKNFWVPDPRDPITGKLLGKPGPIVLADHQCAIVNEALSKRANGLLKYSTIIYSAPKKSGKSALTSAVIQYMAHHSPYSYLYCLANDGKQANDRLYGPISTSYTLQRKHKGPLSDEKPTLTGITLSNGTKIEPLPVDAAGEAGSQPLGTFWSELWGYETPNKRKMWTEMTIPPTLYGYAIRWIETYAGYKGVSELLEQLYQIGFVEGEPHPDFLHLQGRDGPVVRTNERAGMFVYWDTEHRMPWQTRAYYCLSLPENKHDMAVLTDVGWKAAEDVTLYDNIATRNAGGVIKYQKPTSICKEHYCGTLYHLNNARIDVKMTPNHRVLAQYIPHMRKYHQIRSQLPIYEYVEAQDVINNQYGFVPTVGLWHHSPLPDVIVEDLVFDANDFIELLAWYLSEGFVQVDYRHNGPYYNMFSIAQDRHKNEYNYNRIQKLLDRLQLGYTAMDGGFRVFNSQLSRYFHTFGLSYEKYIPRYILDECSWEQLNLFYQTYVFGDGTETDAGKTTLYTNSDQMKDDLMELIFKIGKAPKYYGSYSSSPETGRLPVHHIVANGPDIGFRTYGEKSSWSTVDEDCIVWCPSLPNGNFYVNVKGTCFWTGNSQEAEILPPTEFDRIHNNMWVSPQDNFIREEWWDGCENFELPLLESSHTPVVVGIDMAETGDCAALVAVTRDPFDPDNKVAIRAVRIFNPRRLGGIIDQELDVRPVIEDWAKRWNVVCWVYDPREMSKLAQDLTRDGLGWFRKFGQTNPRAVSDKALYDMIVSKQLSWSRHTTEGDVGYQGDAEQDTLRKHITLAGANTNNESRRLVKLSNNNKIDAAVALSQATHICMELAIGNDEFNVKKLIRQYQKHEITEQEFTDRVRQSNPKLQERLVNDHRRSERV